MKDKQGGYRAYGNKLIDKCYCGGAPITVRNCSGAYVRCTECAEMVNGTDMNDAGWKWNQQVRKFA